jgi:hypothetical protein
MKTNILKTILLCSLLIIISACSVENTNMLGITPSDAIVSISGTDAGAFISKNYQLNTARTDSFTVSITATEVLKKDLSLNLGVSQIGLDLQNSKRKAAGLDDYVTLPNTAYTISPNPVIIKTGTRTAKFSLKVNIPTSIDLVNDYLLPLGIISASDAKINSAMSFVNIGIEGLPNAYEGVYRSVGYFKHPTLPRNIDQDKTLKTIDKTTTETQFADLQNFIMWLRVNKDNTVKLIPKASADALNNLVQTGTNTYDPNTKKFTLNYQYTVDNEERVVNEVITKK